MLDQTYYWEDEKYRALTKEVDQWSIARVIAWHVKERNSRYLPTDTNGELLDPTPNEFSALKKYIVYDLFVGDTLNQERPTI